MEIRAAQPSSPCLPNLAPVQDAYHISVKHPYQTWKKNLHNPQWHCNEQEGGGPDSCHSHRCIPNLPKNSASSKGCQPSSEPPSTKQSNLCMHLPGYHPNASSRNILQDKPCKFGRRKAIALDWTRSHRLTSSSKFTHRQLETCSDSTGAHAQ